MIQNLFRYMWERKVSTIVWILNIFCLIINTPAALFGIVLLDIVFILRGILWEGMKDDEIKRLTKGTIN